MDINAKHKKRLISALNAIDDKKDKKFFIDPKFIAVRKKMLQSLVKPYGDIHPPQGDKPEVLRAEFPEGMDKPFSPSSQVKKTFIDVYYAVKALPDNPAAAEQQLKHELDNRKDVPAEKDWNQLFNKDFNIKYLDRGNRSDEDISLVYEILTKANLPEKLLKYNNYLDELHLGKSLKLDKEIKGFSASWSGNRGVYIFDKAFEFRDKPFRIQTIIGLAEILIHEIAHSIFKSVGKDRGLTKDFIKLRGWKLTDAIGVKPDFIESKTNPKWSYPKKLYFISGYSSKQPSEDFAEAFASYVWQPNFLKEKMPTIYNWIRKEFYRNEDSKAEISGNLVPKKV